MKKRIVSFLLAVIMVISTPTFAFATEAQQANTSVSTENMTVEGTNGFGNLVSQAINDQEAESESAANAGYVVTGMEITGNTATVTYGSIEDATLVVAIYTEDGSELLCSGFTEVSAEEELAIVTIDGEMPEYFWASAYLLDNYDLSPLSNSFESPLYTKDMQELLASSADDYDEARLLNLDNNPDTNFAVFSEETIIVDEQEGVNTVTSVDDSSSTYVIENADESITGLQQGDILAYPYGADEILIVKVDSIRVNGTTVTITGQDVELDEVFDYVKMEGSSEDAKPVVDESVASKGVTYDGLVSFEESAISFFGPTEVEYTDSCGFSLDLELVGTDNAKIKITGSVKLKNEFEVSIYVTLQQQYIYLKDDVSVKLSASVSGSISSDPIPLMPIKIPCAPGLSVGFEPEFSVSVSGKVELYVNVFSTIGFDFKNPKGKDATFESLCKGPEIEWDGAKLEVGFGIEIDMKPTVAFMEKVAKTSLKVPIGVDFSIKKAPFEINGESEHSCNKCYDGTVTGSIAGIIEIKLFDSEMLSKKKELLKFEFELGKFYYSHDHKDFGWGLCPYRSFLLTVVVLDENQNPAKDVELKIKNDKTDLVLGQTNKNGIISKHIAPGGYIISTPSGTLEGQYDITITDEAKKAVVYLGETPSDASINTALGKINPTTVTTATVIDSGKFGAEGDNLTWVLYSDGTLAISGEGAMCTPISFENNYSWPNYSVKKVVIQSGVTSIGNQAFWDCYNLSSIDIPNSVTSIEYNAFLFCHRLSSIVIPNSVTSIGYNAFYNCSSLTNITIPDSVTSIENSTFGACESLTSVTLPNSITSIGDFAFSNCDNLANVYYSGSESQWNAIKIGDYNTSLLNATIHYNSSGPSAVLLADDEEFPVSGEFESTLNFEEAMLTVAPADDVFEEGTEDPAEILPNTSPEDESIDLAAIVGGEYDSTEFETHTLRQATFTDLVPGQQYVILALKDIKAQEPLARSNLVYIDQATALEDGSLVFAFVDRENLDTCYIMACGASNKNLEDAVITFPEMFPSEELQLVNPTVVYDGKTLVENTDYVLLGDVVYSQAGEYTCFVRGIFDYTGLVECDYKIDGYPKGDVNLDGEVNADDLTALARHVAKIETLTDTYGLMGADVDNNDVLSADDLTKLARYVAKIIPSLDDGSCIRHKWLCSGFDENGMPIKYTCSVCKTVGIVVASPFLAPSDAEIEQLDNQTYVFFYSKK